MQRVLVRGHHRSGTTVLCKILRKVPKIFITYELGIYSIPFANVPNKQKVDFLSRVINQTLWSKSDAIRHDSLNLTMSLRDRIGKFTAPEEMVQILEEEIFQGIFPVIGDKFPSVPDIHTLGSLLEMDENLKIIWIYRDGRDVVSSCYRHGGMGKTPEVGDTRPVWSCVDIGEGSEQWGKVMGQWEDVKRQFDGRLDYLEVSFEELMRFPNAFGEIIGDFVGIDPSIIVENHKAEFVKEFTHNKQFEEIIPNWKEEFCPLAMHFLEKLNYI